MWQRAPWRLKQINVSLAPANGSASAHISGETFGWTRLVSETQISDLKFRASPQTEMPPSLSLAYIYPTNRLVARLKGYIYTRKSQIVSDFV